MSVVMDRGGQVIRRSRNLRGLRDHARRTPVVSVEIKETDGRMAEIMAELARTGEPPHYRRWEYLVTYANGDVARDFFADCTVAVEFTRNRRSWGRVPIVTTVPAALAFLAKVSS